MKKVFFFLSISILFITGCKEQTNFTLKGQLDDLASDTLLAFYQTPEYYIDTIICEKGKFEYEIAPDTLTIFSLMLNPFEFIPVYAEKGQTVEIKGSCTNYSIKGSGENQLMNEIIHLLRNTPERSTMNVVDSLINTNNSSFTNLYLFERYYGHDYLPNNNHLKGLIDKQSGIIKDTPFMMDFQAKVNAIFNKSHTPIIHVLNGWDRNGEPIKWNTSRDNYILIDFWASWHPQSMIEQDSLVRVIQALKKEKFQIFSVSLDLDKKAWLEASDRDTTQWHQVCDFNGWNNPIVTSQNIQSLPANILLDKNKRIIAHNIRGNELINKVKERIQKDKEREKEREKNKRKQRRK